MSSICSNDIPFVGRLRQDVYATHNQLRNERRTVLRNRQTRPHSGHPRRGVRKTHNHPLHHDNSRPNHGRFGHHKPASKPILHGFHCLQWRRHGCISQRHNHGHSWIPRQLCHPINHSISQSSYPQRHYSSSELHQACEVFGKQSTPHQCSNKNHDQDIHDYCDQWTNLP